jgi:hypothetical protein
MGEGIVVATRFIEVLLNGIGVWRLGRFPPEEIEESHDEPQAA